MAVIPSFSSFAATPNTADAFLGGVRISQQGREAELDRQLKRQQLAQEAQSDSARIAQAAASDAQRFQIAREQLAAEQVKTQMELEARQKMFEQKAMQDSQEAAIEAAYKNTQIGLADRRLKNAEVASQMRIEEAARAFERNQKYQRIIDAGGTPEQALREAGPGTPGYSKVVGGSPERPPPMDREILSNIRDLENRIKTEHGQLSRLDQGDERIPGLIFSIQEMEKKKAELFQRSRGLSVPPTMTGTNAPVPTTGNVQRELEIPGSLTNSAPRRLRFNPATGRLE